MKIKIKILFFLLFPFLTIAQKTYIPDDAFEQALINLDLDDIFDDSVYTSAVDTVTILYIPNKGIMDLTGIEDFSSLRDLFCYNNDLISLDLSNNNNLFELNCRNNQLTFLSVKNGNPTGLWFFTAQDNTDLFCVEVDNVAYVYANYWQIDSQAAFSTNCSPSSLEETYKNKMLVKVVDLLGREINKKNQPLLYIYDDGTVEKIIITK